MWKHLTSAFGGSTGKMSPNMFTFVSTVVLGLIVGYLQLPIPTNNPLKKITININNEVWVTEGSSFRLDINTTEFLYVNWFFLDNTDLGVAVPNHEDSTCRTTDCTIYPNGSLLVTNARVHHNGSYTAIIGGSSVELKFMVHVMSTEELMTKMGGEDWGPMAVEPDTHMKPLMLYGVPDDNMSDSADYQVFCVIMIAMAVFFTVGLVLYCCYHQYYNKTVVGVGSSLWLINGAEARSPLALCDKLEWHELGLIGLVGVAIVALICIVAYMCWKYPPKCRKSKSLWITAPLLLLLIAAPSNASIEQIEIESGSTVIFQPLKSNFSFTQWEKALGNTSIPIGFVNATEIEIFTNTKNQTGIKLLSLYSNGTAKLSNCSTDTSGLYQANQDGNVTTFINLTVIPQLTLPIINITQLSNSSCLLLCDCSAFNSSLSVTFKNNSLNYPSPIIVSPENASVITCASHRSHIFVKSEVSVNQSCLQTTKIITLNYYNFEELWWMLLSLVLMVMIAWLWLKMARLRQRRVNVFTVPLLLLMVVCAEGDVIVATLQGDVTMGNITLPEKFFNNSENAVSWIKDSDKILYQYKVNETEKTEDLKDFKQNFTVNSTKSFELTLKNLTVQGLGNYDCLFTTHEKNVTYYTSTSFKVQLTYSKYQPKSPPAPAPAPTETIFYYKASDVPWWLYAIIIIFMVAVYFLVFVCISSSFKKAALLGPLVLLMIAVPPANAAETNLQATEGGDLNFNIKITDTYKSLKWYKNSANRQHQTIVSATDSSVTPYSPYEALGFTEISFDAANGNLIIQNLYLNASGNYTLTVVQENGQGKDYDYRVQINNKIIITQAPETVVKIIKNPVKDYWWAFLLLALTIILFTVGGLKMWLDKDIGILDSDYVYPAPPALTKNLLLIACICLLLPSGVQSECKTFNTQLYALVGQEVLINASVTTADYVKYQWKFGQSQVLVENNNGSVHYFIHAVNLQSNGSLTFTAALNFSGTYILQCTNSKGIQETGATVVNVKNVCKPPTLLTLADSVVSSNDYSTKKCHVNVTCVSECGNPVYISNKNHSDLTVSASYHPDLTSPSVTCHCDNGLTKAQTTTNIHNFCQQTMLSYSIFPQHHNIIHLWWIYGLIMLIIAAILGYLWWWKKTHMDSVKTASATHNLKDPVDII
uniref:E3 protein n=1 Tax=Rhinolophus ferrumequinum adenovirus TaxID=3140013 RepID=A0AAU6S554_9ADEN